MVMFFLKKNILKEDHIVGKSLHTRHGYAIDNNIGKWNYNEKGGEKVEPSLVT